MSNENNGLRLAVSDGNSLPDGLDDARVCYWKYDGIWWIYLPRAGIGNLSRHAITEHEDGTITASPSILLTGHNCGKPMQRHGYLERGVWREC